MTVLHADLHPLICQAIRARRRLSFEYDGLLRIVEPYCHGRSSKGSELLRAVEVKGARNTGFGKLWTVSKLLQIELGDAFDANDPNYNPDDSAMAFIHCRVG
jgi:hypothetical protein